MVERFFDLKMTNKEKSWLQRSPVQQKTSQQRV